MNFCCSRTVRASGTVYCHKGSTKIRGVNRRWQLGPGTGFIGSMTRNSGVPRDCIKFDPTDLGASLVCKRGLPAVTVVVLRGCATTENVRSSVPHRRPWPPCQTPALGSITSAFAFSGSATFSVILHQGYRSKRPAISARHSQSSRANRISSPASLPTRQGRDQLAPPRFERGFVLQPSTGIRRHPEPSEQH